MSVGQASRRLARQAARAFLALIAGAASRVSKLDAAGSATDAESRFLEVGGESIEYDMISKVSIDFHRLFVKLADGRVLCARLADVASSAAEAAASSAVIYDRGGPSSNAKAARVVFACVAPVAYLGLAYHLLMRAQSGPRDASVAKRFKEPKKKRDSADDESGFARVAGVDSALRELEDVVLAIKFPERLASVGAKCPRGVLLTGPSGTGKTLLAAAVAGEAGVPFLSCSASAFVEVRDLFDRARKVAPCIVFIDEVDAIAKTRDRFGQNDEREQTLNQLLCELDGFNSKEEDGPPVVLIAATNRPECLDAALVRPGRLDKIVIVPLPDANGRFAILRLHAKRLTLDADVDLAAVSAECHHYSGADMANVANEAALLALRDNATKVGQRHFAVAILKRNQARAHVMQQR
ncbi:P-loop containing nucleoside triphosphate hydrolase protein [Pelagophyceae sp. CCMP2097]|nr:P-loop containing nucleoside triphosphate hydrolase protein [Pelagophyceae sp. CCMP2097]